MCYTMDVMRVSEDDKTMKCGDTFQGRRLIRQLDSGKKKYRQVFLCEGENEVITVYNSQDIPMKMRIGNDGLPLEYLWYVQYKDVPNTWLPRLIEYGYDSEHVWLITKYIDLCFLSDYLGDKNCSEREWKELFDAFVSYMLAAFSANPMLCQTSVPLCLTPDNIFVSEKENGYLECYLTGIDTLLYPAYGEFKEADGFDARYLAPEIFKGEYDLKSISYSLCLSILTIVNEAFPTTVPDLSNVLAPEDIVLLVQERYRSLNSFSWVPATECKRFRSFINPDYRCRSMLNDDVKGEMTVCGEDITPQMAHLIFVWMANTNNTHCLAS